MTPEQFQAFKTAITTAVEEHIAKGGVIINRTFSNETGGVCPIRALFKISTLDLNDFTTVERVSKVMGFDLSYQEVWSFIDGVDDTESSSLDAQMRLFGEEIRSKYLDKQFLKG